MIVVDDSEKRAKRSTRFSGDFHAKFDLGSSDEEYDSDAPKKKKGPSRASTGGSKAKRTKECPGCGAKHSVSVKECSFCDYQFTSKSMLVSNQSAQEESQSIRDRFPFEPEREEDGSLIIQAIVGRRPRQTNHRWPKTSVDTIDIPAITFEYHKFIVEAMNNKSKQTLYRYLTRIDRGEIVAEDGEFDPSFIEVEKVLDVKEEEVDEIVDDLVDDPVEILDDVPENVLMDDKPTTDIKKIKTNIESKVEMNGHKSQNNDSNSNNDVMEESKLSSSLVHKVGSLESLTSKSINDESITTDDPTAAKSLFKIFNHVERIKALLNRIWDDPYAISFRDPVDTEEYDDYLDIVDEPICLSDVKTKLENGEYNKYFYHVKFANDMRKIWHNCKVYNLYQSQIWYSAHALSLMFERLFQGWVVMFSDGLIDYNDPVGRPWESSCRVCLQDENDQDLMLCDHCDAAYHIYCLRPKLKAVPDGPWICPRCISWFTKTGKKMLSATAEEEARQYAEGAKSRKIIKVKKKKYLVKWRGLSYRECTWETVEDINDDDRIAEYHKINDNPPEEPPLTKAEIGYELSKDRKLQLLPPSRIPNPVQDLDAIIYAQIRSYHFLKWKKIPPHALLRESGSAGLAYVRGMKRSLLVENDPNIPSTVNTYSNVPTIPSSTTTIAVASTIVSSLEKPKMSETWFTPDGSDPVLNEVSDLLADLVYFVSRAIPSIHRDPYPTRPKLPSPHQAPSEIEICIPKHSKGLGLQLGNYMGAAMIMNFRKESNMGYEKRVLDLMTRVKLGDVIVAIDGSYLFGVNYSDILSILKKKFRSPQNYIYLRLLRLPASDVDSSNPDAIRSYFENKSQKEYLRPFPLRSKYFGVFPAPFHMNQSQKWIAQYYQGKTYKHIVIGEYDDELVAAKAYDMAIKSANISSKIINFDEHNHPTPSAKVLRKVVEGEREENNRRVSRLIVENTSSGFSTSSENLNQAIKKEGETTKMNDVKKQKENKDNEEDKSKNNQNKEKDTKENQEEEDEIDNNSYDSRDSDTEIATESSDSESDGSDDLDEHVWAGKESEDDEDWKPKKVENLLESDGPMGRFLRAVNESDAPPLKSEWSNYLLDQFPLELKPNLIKKKKILQIDMANYSILREWDSIPEIARTLGISIIDIQAVLVNKKDTAGGFIWRYSTVMPTSYNGDDDDDNNNEDGEVITDSYGEVVKKVSNANWKSKLYTESKEYRSGGKLRDYQVDGLNWLLTCWYSKRSSILADEMGLGKTVQVVSFLDHLFEVEKLRGPYLVCVPLSTIQHWKREADTWTNMITCLYHDAGGGRDMRDIIREYEWYYKGHSRRLLKFHLLITTYDDLIRDYEELAEIPWRVVVVDEAHRLRNLNSKLLECMRSVVAKGMIAYGYQHRVLMTGTPLQNNTSELWTLLNFIEPAKFPSIEKFADKYGQITTQEQVESLQFRLSPHLLRRVKEDVAKDIPPKEETIIDVELTTIQKQYYRAIFEKNHSFLLQNLKGTVPKLMNIQMELRKCCNHPFLVDGVEQYEMEQLDGILAQEGITNYLPTFNKQLKLRASDSNATGTSHHSLKGRNLQFERRRMEQYVIPTSGKMVLIDKLLPKLQKEGHKVLIFSQMVKMIDIIDEYCEFRGYSCERLDGRISGNERQKAIDRFNRDSKSFIFLLSTRAGGVGINLTAADTVIIFDSDWNPQNDVQAMARCHRIGQSKNVTIYRLITRRSFEASMFERASKKLGLEQAVLGSRQFGDIDGEDPSKNPKMDAKELEQLLKEGAYSVLLEDNSDDIKEFFDQDIEKLLQQRAHVMVAETTATESWLNKKNLKVKTKKSLFTGDLAMEHAEIDVNDPDFWKKVLPDLVTPDSLLERLSDENFGTVIREEEEESGTGSDSVEKFLRDLTQMIEGMVDLKNRGQLPEKQRETCMKLLLRISMKDDIFEPEDIGLVKDWLATIEGTRKRTRIEVAPTNNMKGRGKGSRGGGGNSNRIGGGGGSSSSSSGGPGSRGGRGSRSRSSSNRRGSSVGSASNRYDDDNDDDLDSNPDSDDNDNDGMGLDERPTNRGRGSRRGGGRGSRGGVGRVDGSGRGRGRGGNGSARRTENDSDVDIDGEGDDSTIDHESTIQNPVGIENVKGVLVKKKYNRKKSSSLDLSLVEGEILEPRKRKARAKTSIRDSYRFDDDNGDDDDMSNNNNDDDDDDSIDRRKKAKIIPKKRAQRNDSKKVQIIGVTYENVNERNYVDDDNEDEDGFGRLQDDDELISDSDRFQKTASIKGRSSNAKKRKPSKRQVDDDDDDFEDDEEMDD